MSRIHGDRSSRYRSDESSFRPFRVTAKKYALSVWLTGQPAEMVQQCEKSRLEYSTVVERFHDDNVIVLSELVSKFPCLKTMSPGEKRITLSLNFIYIAGVAFFAFIYLCAQKALTISLSYCWGYDMPEEEVSLPQAGRSRARIRLGSWNIALSTLVRMIVVVAFGLIVPVALLLQAYSSMKGVNTASIENGGMALIIDSMPETVRKLEKTNDYIFMTAFFVEMVNQRALASKQRMKIAVMHIGFAVISLGLLLVLLGIDVGGIAISGRQAEGGVSLSVKIASTGVVVFMSGALLAGFGGLVHSRYQTIAIPQYVINEAIDSSKVSPGEAQDVAHRLSQKLSFCDGNVEDRDACRIDIIKSDLFE